MYDRNGKVKSKLIFILPDGTEEPALYGHIPQLTSTVRFGIHPGKEFFVSNIEYYVNKEATSNHDRGNLCAYHFDDDKLPTVKIILTDLTAR